MNNNISLFDDVEMQESLTYSSPKIDVVKMDFIEAQPLSWEDLFDGFDALHAITYSSGIDFICKLLAKFEKAEIIFGCDEVMSYSLQEIMAFQLKTIERLRDFSSKNKVELVSRIDDESLKMYVARGKMSHEKVYMLSASDGRYRVVFGSANMSHSAFSGRQRENICFIDGNKAYEWYKDSFENLKSECSDDITIGAITFSDDSENLEQIPIMNSVKVHKALVIEIGKESTEDIRFALDIKGLAEKFKSYVPVPDKKGKLLLSPEKVTQTRRRIIEANIQEKELRSEYPQLVVDIFTASASLNEKILDLSPNHDELISDVRLFLEYMNGYSKFHGDVTGMQCRYFEFANWFFATPFMATMRNIAVKYNQNLLPYPVFGLVYGQSKAGKTTFLETLLKMMIGQKTKMSAPDFTRTSIEGLKRAVKGAPIIVDDLTNTRFATHAIETIKNDDFGVVDSLYNYPAVVISANEDVKAVAPEIIRRTVICRAGAGLTNTELMKSSVVRKVQKNIGTAFYREYLRRMLEVVPDLIEVLKEDEDSSAPDILAVSSEIICDIIKENSSEPLPFYARNLSLNDYFSEKVTGAYAIKSIQNAWNVNRKAFVVDKRNNELRYNAGQTWEADRIIKELPEDLEPHKSREWVVIMLDRACDFFGINFKKTSLLDMFRK